MNYFLISNKHKTVLHFYRYRRQELLLLKKLFRSTKLAVERSNIRDRIEKDLLNVFTIDSSIIQRNVISFLLFNITQDHAMRKT